MIKFNKRGFALIEVLISMVVLGIALNGVGQFWNKTVRESEHNYARSQAIIIARNIIESIRANSATDPNGAIDPVTKKKPRPGLIAYTTPANWTNDIDDTFYNKCKTEKCTQTDIALADIFVAREYARTSLPFGEGKVLIQSPCAQIVGNESRCVIVSWNEDRTPAQCEPLKDGSGELDSEKVANGVERETAKCVVVDFI